MALHDIKPENLFDRVAGAMREGGSKPATKQLVCAALIEELQNAGWQDEHLSLNRFQEDPAIVEAFRENGIEL